MRAIDDIVELFIEEAELIRNGKMSPKALDGARDFRELLEMTCSYDPYYHRMLHDRRDDDDHRSESEKQCQKAWRLLH